MLLAARLVNTGSAKRCIVCFNGLESTPGTIAGGRTTQHPPCFPCKGDIRRWVMHKAAGAGYLVPLQLPLLKALHCRVHKNPSLALTTWLCSHHSNPKHPIGLPTCSCPAAICTTTRTERCNARRAPGHSAVSCMNLPVRAECVCCKVLTDVLQHQWCSLAC